MQCFVAFVCFEMDLKKPTNHLFAKTQRYANF